MQPVRTRRGGLSLNVVPPRFVRWSARLRSLVGSPLVASLSEKSPRVGGSVRKITRRCVNDHLSLWRSALVAGLEVDATAIPPTLLKLNQWSRGRSQWPLFNNGTLDSCALHHSTVDDSSAFTECVERKPLSSPAVAEAAAEKKHDQDDDENPSPDRHRLSLLSSARRLRAAAHLDANIRLVTRNAYRGHGEHPATPMRVKPRSCATSS